MISRPAASARRSPAEGPIEIDLGDGIRVTGRIDLIRRRSTNEVIVIDFKSNDRTQQEEVTDLQLLYALGYEQATGERANEVVVDNLDDLAHPRRSFVDAAMLVEAAEAVREVGGRLRGNAYPRTPRGATAADRDHTCERCDLVGICGGHTNGFQ